MTPSNFGSARHPASTYDPDIIEGWDKREYNWQFSAGVQHELMPRSRWTSATTARGTGTVSVTDNRAWTAADFDRFSITAPADSRLPGGGGYTVSGSTTSSRTGSACRPTTSSPFAKNYGKQTRRWDGVDLTFNARPGRGLMFQGGTSSGWTTTDICDIVDDLPGDAASPRGTWRTSTRTSGCRSRIAVSSRSS